MKKYNNRETTPLFYHSIFLYFILPVNVITNILSLTANFNSLTYQTELFKYVLIDFIFALLLAVLSSVTFWGLRKWTPYSWYAIHISNLTIIVYSLIVIGIYFSVEFSSPSELAEPFAKITVAILVSIYYWKRKGLFFYTENNPTKELSITKDCAIIEEQTPNPITKEKIITPEIVEENENFVIENCSPSKVTVHKTSKNFSKPVIILSVILICSLIGNIYQFSSSSATIEENKSLHRELASLSSRYETKVAEEKKYYTKYLEMKDAYRFYDNHAVIVPEYSQRYHKHGCQYLDLSSFWIYNTEAAKSNGYVACPHCITD